MKKILFLGILILGFSFSSVYAGGWGTAPTCIVEGKIKSLELEKGRFDRCVYDEKTCPMDYIPVTEDSYAIQFEVISVQAVEETFESCSDQYKNGEILKGNLRRGDTFKTPQVGDIFQTQMWGLRSEKRVILNGVEQESYSEIGTKLVEKLHLETYSQNALLRIQEICLSVNEEKLQKMLTNIENLQKSGKYEKYNDFLEYFKAYILYLR